MAFAVPAPGGSGSQLLYLIDTRRKPSPCIGWTRRPEGDGQARSGTPISMDLSLPSTTISRPTSPDRVDGRLVPRK